MAHRRNITMIDVDQTPQEIADQMLASMFTRVPLYRGRRHNVIGVVHAKAFLKALQSAQGDVTKVDVVAIAGKPWFIPDSTTLLDQLRAFRQRREHFALVVDEYGTLMGIVTLEDILEEIVGDIADEHDRAVAGVRPQPDGSFVIDGTVTIRDLNREFEWGLPDDEAATIAGLVLQESRRIPEVGQEFTFHGFRFVVLRRQRNQIALLKVVPPTAAPAIEAPSAAAAAARFGT
jgi:Mg2+/Co2+ transporter CorB